MNIHFYWYRCCGPLTSRTSLPLLCPCQYNRHAAHGVNCVHNSTAPDEEGTVFSLYSHWTMICCTLPSTCCCEWACLNKDCPLLPFKSKAYDNRHVHSNLWFFNKTNHKLFSQQLLFVASRSVLLWQYWHNSRVPVKLRTEKSLPYIHVHGARPFCNCFWCSVISQVVQGTQWLHIAIMRCQSIPWMSQLSELCCSIDTFWGFKE